MEIWRRWVRSHQLRSVSRAVGGRGSIVPPNARRHPATPTKPPYRAGSDQLTEHTRRTPSARHLAQGHRRDDGRSTRLLRSSIFSASRPPQESSDLRPPGWRERDIVSTATSCHGDVTKLPSAAERSDPHLQKNCAIVTRTVTEPTVTEGIKRPLNMDGVFQLD